MYAKTVNYQYLKGCLPIIMRYAISIISINRYWVDMNFWMWTYVVGFAMSAAFTAFQTKRKDNSKVQNLQILMN